MVIKILRFENILLLGEINGQLEMINLNTNKIVFSQSFDGAGLAIYDIIAFSDSEFLLATQQGLIKATRNTTINTYFLGKTVSSLC